MLKYCILLICLTIFGKILKASDFEEGIRFYKEQQWVQARESFEKHLTSHPTDVNTLYNIGICLLHEKKYVNASWYFEKAYKLNPGEKDYQIQLDNCYQQLGLMKSWSPPLSLFETKLINFSLQSWALLLIGFSILIGTLLFLVFVLKRNRKAIFSFLVLVAGIWVFVLYAFITKVQFTNNPTHGIVIERINSVFTSNIGNAIKEFDFKAGERVEIGSVGKRIEIILTNKEHIWLKPHQIKLIR